jgi:hypothetical protein
MLDDELELRSQKHFSTHRGACRGGGSAKLRAAPMVSKTIVSESMKRKVDPGTQFIVR